MTMAQPGPHETIETWISSDITLSRLLEEIQSSHPDMNDRADAVFREVSALYGLPNFPTDVDAFPEEEQDLWVPVYTTLGKVKFLSPEEPPDFQVLMAQYLVKEHYDIDDQFVIDQGRAQFPKPIVGLGFRGENAQVEMVFIEEGQLWFELGCKVFHKVV